jgi:hypothetical protein
MIHTDEDDEFERIARENAMKSGQPYFFDGVYVSVSQRNQVLEEAAKMCETFDQREMFNDDDMAVANACAEAIRGMKK